MAQALVKVMGMAARRCSRHIWQQLLSRLQRHPVQSITYFTTLASRNLIPGKIVHIEPPEHAPFLLCPVPAAGTMQSQQLYKYNRSNTPKVPMDYDTLLRQLIQFENLSRGARCFTPAQPLFQQ
ncbi:MAG TPA: hypothetical protein DD856_14285 [Sulfobacillus sp.]|nr:hypothetical protein [Sulfobacillus sp.]